MTTSVIYMYSGKKPRQAGSLFIQEQDMTKCLRWIETMCATDKKEYQSSEFGCTISSDNKALKTEPS
jgi:hypothetical protein